MPEFILAAECEHCRRDNEMVKRALGYPGILIHGLQNIQKKCIHCGSTGTFNYGVKKHVKLPEENRDAVVVDDAPEAEAPAEPVKPKKRKKSSAKKKA